jgi:hypothetical protein
MPTDAKEIKPKRYGKHSECLEELTELSCLSITSIPSSLIYNPCYIDLRSCIKMY